MSAWLVTGASGMLGGEVVSLLAAEGETVTGLDHAGLDVTDGDAVRATLRAVRPDVVVNCAGWTAVDAAEEHEEEALRVNGDGARNLALACAAIGARLVQVSTDYVFDGTAREPYAEDAPPGPIGAYGRTKLAGERAVLAELPSAAYVVRTAWLYGRGGPNFVATMLRLEREREKVEVVVDQRGQPTWTRDVAGRVLALVRSGAEPGIYHATSSGQTTWWGLAREIFQLLGADEQRVLPTTADRFARPAPRPAYGVLGHGCWERAGLEPIRDWRAALRAALLDGLG
ncbi:dTDP-4-dehydrorhamnose reductase [Actinoallomurus sp. CA-150999]|uniref:dTDP-4-dehydrorhamnose reductase n=1 Tax=Actinoallomurus sp. CA-150999 TaxID=3239887 RepID=UPI003D8ACAA0